MIYWKHHLAQHFIEGAAPTKNNGVGEGGTVFQDFNQMIQEIGTSRYFVCPVELSDHEVVPMGNNKFTSLVCRIGVGDFAALDFWKENLSKLV